MRCHCGRGQETYEHFMWCEQYKGIEEPLVRDQDVPLLKKGERGRSAVEGELQKEGHRKGLWHMVIVKSLWRALQEHTVAPEAMEHRLLRRMVEHLQERMACRETRAEDMRDPVTKWVKMALIRYNPRITEMEVQKQPDWQQRGSGGETGVEDRGGEKQRERLMARRRRRIRQIRGQAGCTMSRRRGTSVGGPEEKGQQWRPSHELERPGLGTRSHRAEQDAGQGGADWGHVTRGKQSGHEHGDRRAGSRGGYQEMQADKRSVAGGAATRTTTVQTRMRPTAARQSPQNAGE